MRPKTTTCSKCERCGKPCKKPKARFCSRECFRLTRRKPRQRCKQCGKPCTWTARSKFCSRACHVAWRTGRPCPSRRVPRLRKRCPVCKKKFDVKPWNAEQKLCSMDCAVIWRTKSIDECKKFSFNGAWRRRREEVLERDEHKCVFCQSRANSVHHLVPREQGGKHGMDNLVTACWPCHNAMDKVIRIMFRLNPAFDLHGWLASFVPDLKI